jgi:hypothetical protein
MVERGFTKLVGGDPIIGLKERAYLDCGCSCWVGLRFDSLEPVSLAEACGTDHDALIQHFNLLLRESLVEPQVRELVDVADDLLAQTASFIGAKP